MIYYIYSIKNKSDLFKGFSKLCYFHIFIGDPHIFIGDPHIFIGDPRKFNGDSRFSLESPMFRWRPPYFHWRPSYFHWRPIFLLEIPFNMDIYNFLLSLKYSSLSIFHNHSAYINVNRAHSLKL